MSRKNTNQPEYGAELKLAAVRRVLAGQVVPPGCFKQQSTRRRRLWFPLLEMREKGGTLAPSSSLLLTKNNGS